MISARFESPSCSCLFIYFYFYFFDAPLPYFIWKCVSTKHCKDIIRQMVAWESLNNHLKHGGGSLFVPDNKILSSVKFFFFSVGLFRALKLFISPLSLISQSQAMPESTIFPFCF